MKSKTEFKYFTIMDWEKEEEYLQLMHKAGWKLVSISFPGFYHFTECEPEDVVYRLDYNQEAEKERDEYLQLFEDCGWEYILKFVGYSYFRKKVGENIQEDCEIFGDVQSKLDMCKRVVKGRLLPLFIIFCLVIVPQLVMNFNQALNGNSYSTDVTFVFSVLFIGYLFIFISFAFKYWKVKKQHE